MKNILIYLLLLFAVAVIAAPTWSLDWATTGGGDPWTPADLPSTDLFAWYDASDTNTITSAGGAVSQIDDKSTNNQHAVQAFGPRQPTTGTRTNAGLNVLDFDGGDVLRDTSFTLPGSGDVTFFIVAEVDAAGEFDSLVSVNAARDFQYQGNGMGDFDGAIAQSGIGSDKALTGGPFNGPSVHALAFDYTVASNYNAYVDGTKRTTDTAYTATLQASQELRIFANRGDSKYVNGAFAEMVIVKDVTTVTRQKIEGYLAWKWGLQANLPVGHPYKSAAPTQ